MKVRNSIGPYHVLMIFVVIKKVIIVPYLLSGHEHGVKCTKKSKYICIMLRNLRKLFRTLIFISHNNIWECLIAQICIYLFIVV